MSTNRCGVEQRQRSVSAGIGAFDTMLSVMVMVDVDSHNWFYLVSGRDPPGIFFYHLSPLSPQCKHLHIRHQRTKNNHDSMLSSLLFRELFRSFSSTLAVWSPPSSLAISGPYTRIHTRMRMRIKVIQSTITLGIINILSIQAFLIIHFYFLSIYFSAIHWDEQADNWFIEISEMFPNLLLRPQSFESIPSSPHFYHRCLQLIGDRMSLSFNHNYSDGILHIPFLLMKLFLCSYCSCLTFICLNISAYLPT